MTGEVNGIKLKTVQKFTQDGHRIPVTGVKVDSVEGFQLGDLLKVTGWAKGKGFTGVVKRWGFKGGPRTHGQSDRQRSPGSIGQTTTPGRVFKGKKMPGHYGQVTITELGKEIVKVYPEKNLLLVKGGVPGPKGSRVFINKWERK